MSHYTSGASTPSLDVLTKWAEVVGVRLAVLEPHIAAVSRLASLAEELSRDELAVLERVAQALLGTRDAPTRRAVLAASLSMAVAQVDDATPVLGLLARS